jgi:hypothetical protein
MGKTQTPSDSIYEKLFLVENIAQNQRIGSRAALHNFCDTHALMGV